MYYSDYHNHSSYSPDSQAPILDMAKAGLAKGLSEIVITDHFEPSEINKEFLYYRPKDQEREIQQAQALLAGQVIIKQGIELGQPHVYPKLVNHILDQVAYDYVIGSVHKTGGFFGYGMIDYDKINMDQLMRVYFKDLKALAASPYYDCIGHLDLPKRYASMYGIQVSVMDYQDLLVGVLKEVIHQGKGIEINTSGLRGELKAPLPSLDVIDLYKQLGGTIITVGSDSHKAQDVGAGIKDVYQDLVQLGIEEVTLFNQRQARQVSIKEEILSEKSS